MIDAMREKNSGRRDALLEELRALAAAHPEDVVVCQSLAMALHNAREQADDNNAEIRDALREELRALAAAHPKEITLRERPTEVGTADSTPRGTIVSPFVTDWAKSLVERAVASNPDNTAALGQSRLTEMKARYSVILNNIPSQAVAELSRDDVWPHRQAISEDDMGDTMFAFNLRQRNTEQLDNAIRELVSDVRSLLIEYGFATASDRSEWRGRQGGKPRYSYAIPDYRSAPQLGKTRDEYGEALEEWASASRRLRDAKRAKASAEAKMLWDEA